MNRTSDTVAILFYVLLLLLQIALAVGLPLLIIAALVKFVFGG